MNDLDQKLREIWDESVIKAIDNRPGFSAQIVPKAIAQIKQAFQDAGYSKVKTIWHHPDVPVMTGPEWYERFRKELESSTGEPFGYTKVLGAAKRASGVKDD